MKSSREPETIRPCKPRFYRPGLQRGTPLPVRRAPPATPSLALALLAATSLPAGTDWRPARCDPLLRGTSPRFSADVPALYSAASIAGRFRSARSGLRGPARAALRRSWVAGEAHSEPGRPAMHEPARL